MTQEDLAQLYLLVQNDHSAVEALKAAPNKDAFFSTLVRLGNEKGYKVDVQEIKQLAKTNAAVAGNRELSDAELESVAGGGDCGCFGTWDGGKSTNW
jgi:predicted ribosomally synthesized peptide with nif11-like leader